MQAMGKRRGKGRVPDFANLEPRTLTDKQGSMYVAFHAYGAKRHRYSHVSILTNKNQESPRMFFHTRGDRKVLIKMLSFLYLSLFRDEISSNNAVIYMQLFHCNNASIIRARALQLSLWKHRLTLCGATFYFYFKVLLSSRYCNTRSDCVRPHFI